MTTRSTPRGHAVWTSARAALALATLALVTLTGCNRGEQAQQMASTGASDTSVDAVLPARKAPALPRVPFNQQPCQSLSAADMTALHFPTPVHTVPYKETPDSLPYDNACRWYNGGTELALIAYMTQEDYDGTSQSMRSTQHVAPTDIPGAFYDQQGYLWFAKNGYSVEIGPGSKSREAVARLLAGKL